MRMKFDPSTGAMTPTSESSFSSSSEKKRGRPKKEAIAFDPEATKEFIKRLFTIEAEIKVLKNDKADLKEEFKNSVDAKVVAKIIRLVKLKLDMNNCSPETIQEIEDAVKDKIGMVL